jgi:hypothetical protein
MTAFKLVAIFPLAWFGGNLVFGLLASGSWLPSFLHAVLQEWAFNAAMTSVLWVCRIVVFLLLMVEMFERPLSQAKERT